MKQRIAKFIAESGIASRRVAEELITSGAVTVNGIQIDTPVFFVDEKDDVVIDGKRLTGKQETKLYSFLLECVRLEP